MEQHLGECRVRDETAPNVSWLGSRLSVIIRSHFPIVRVWVCQRPSGLCMWVCIVLLTQNRVKNPLPKTGHEMRGPPGRGWAREGPPVGLTRGAFGGDPGCETFSALQGFSVLGMGIPRCRFLWHEIIHTVSTCNLV